MQDLDLVAIWRRRRNDTRLMFTLLLLGASLFCGSMENFFNSGSTIVAIVLLVLSIPFLFFGAKLFFHLRKPDPALSDPDNPPDKTIL